MNNKNISVLIAERDRCWAEIRKYESKLSEIIAKSTPPCSFDFILFFQCIGLVLTDLALYEDEFLDVDEDIRKLFKDNSPSGALQKILKEVDCWKSIGNENLSLEERLKAIEDLRKNLWGNLSCKRDEIVNIMQIFPLIDDLNDFALMLQCVSTVIVELSLKEKELELLGINDFPEK